MPERLAPDVANYIAKDKSIREQRRPITEKLPIPSLEEIPLELRQTAESVATISDTWNPVEIFTADSSSLNTEKKKFLEAYDNGETYNPQFTYSYAQSLDLADQRTALTQQLRRLRQFAPGNRHQRLFRTALYFKIKDDLATCDLVDGLKTKNEKKIARAMKQKYPGTDQAILEAATTTYNHLLLGTDNETTTSRNGNYPLTPEEQDFLKNREFSDAEIAKAFEWALDQYGILRSKENPQGFQVKIDKEATAIDVRDKSKDGPTVFIPAGRTVKADKALEYIGHEIEGHARQSINGERTFLLGGGRLKVDNEMLYEGLGKRYDERFRRKFFGTSSGEPLPYYTFAIASAENGASFYEIFAQQMDLRLRARLKIGLDQSLPDRQHIDPAILTATKDNAWTTTYRVMRGHTDTSNKSKFAMAKDLSYLRGWLIDKQLENNGLGFLNEEGVIASGGLQLLAELKLSQDQLPLPFKDVTTKYWEEVLKPQMPKAA